MAHQLRRWDLEVERQVPVAIEYLEVQLDEGFRADLIVENKVVVELECVEHSTTRIRASLIIHEHAS